MQGSTQLGRADGGLESGASMAQDPRRTSLVSIVALEDLARSKVGQFDVHVLVQQDVLGLEIPGWTAEGTSRELRASGKVRNEKPL